MPIEDSVLTICPALYHRDDVIYIEIDTGEDLVSVHVYVSFQTPGRLRQRT